MPVRVLFNTAAPSPRSGYPTSKIHTQWIHASLHHGGLPDLSAIAIAVILFTLLHFYTEKWVYLRQKLARNKTA